jgi:hypothetical protein
MKYLAGFLTLIGVIIFSLPPQMALADSTVTFSDNFNSQSSNTSQSTNTSRSTVNCNGKSVISDSPNVNVQDNNGNCQVTFGDNAQEVSITATPEPTAESTPSVTLTPTPTDIPTATPVPPTATSEAIITPDPTIMQMRRDINKQVEKQVATLKEHLKHQDHAISVFFKSGVVVLQNFFSGLFK